MSQPDRFLNTFIALRGRLTRIVMGMVPPKEVEDIVQETYVRVCQIEHKDRIRDPSSFMYRTAKNLAFDYLKRAETTKTTSMDELGDYEYSTFDLQEDETFARVASNEEFGIFCDAVRNLPKQCRRAFVLKKVYGYSVQEIADEMGIGKASVDSHIITGTRKCVQYLRKSKDTGVQNKQFMKPGKGAWRRERS